MKIKSIVTFLLLATCFNLGAMSKRNKSKLNRNLLRAVTQNDAQQAEQLIKAGADVNQIDYNGDTLLYKATEKGHTEIAKLLINAKADIDKTNRIGYTPLCWACWGRTHNSQKIALLLIQTKANVNIANSFEETPLSWAALNGHTEITELLIDAGALINATDNHKRTPLYWAAENRTRGIALLLLRNGAHINNEIRQKLIRLNFPQLYIEAAQGNLNQTLAILKEVSSTLGREDIYINQNLLEIAASHGYVEMLYLFLHMNPNRTALYPAFLKVKKKTDDKNMMIQKMLVCWDNMQEKTEQASSDTRILRIQFDKIMLHTAIQHKQLNLLPYLFVGLPQGYMVGLITQVVAKRKQLQKQLDQKMTHLKKTEEERTIK